MKILKNSVRWLKISGIIGDENVSTQKVIAKWILICLGFLQFLVPQVNISLKPD